MGQFEVAAAGVPQSNRCV